MIDLNMNNVVVILYRAETAHSALDQNYTGEKPFCMKGKYSGYNRSYSYLIEKLKALGLKPKFTTTSDILGSGHFKSYWTFKKGKWERHSDEIHTKVIFDKFTPNTPQEVTLLKTAAGCKCIKTYNSRFINKLFGDKFNTYEALKKHCIPTVKLESFSKIAIEKATKNLRKIMRGRNKKLSTHGILKDRTGGGGYGIHKINLLDTNFKRLAKLNAGDQKDKMEIDYVLQPFIDCEAPYNNKSAQVSDLRLIYAGKKIKQAYVRTAADDDFRCNTSQGGNIYYLSPNEVPEDIRLKANEILDFMGESVELEHQLFALDFVSTPNDEIYLMEGNCNPGIIWTKGNQADEDKTKELISIISNGLKQMIQNQKGDLKCQIC